MFSYKSQILVGWWALSNGDTRVILERSPDHHLHTVIVHPGALHPLRNQNLWFRDHMDSVGTDPES